MYAVLQTILTIDQLYRDGKRVLECLQRALRVADACMDTAVSVELFVEILNRYVYYFDQQNETVRSTLLRSKQSYADLPLLSRFAETNISSHFIRSQPSI